MSFWSGETLKANKSVVEDFSDAQIDVNAYNLRMGDSYFRTADGSVVKEAKKMKLQAGEAFIIPPGQFAFLVSREVVRVPPDAMAFISMRTKIKFEGLINVSGFHVDPGYNGKLVYSVYNASPASIQICEGDNLFKIWFAQLDRTSEPPYLFDGKAQAGISNELVRGMSQEVFSLQALAVKMRELEASINQKLAEQKPVIDNLTFIWRAVQLAILGALILAFLTAAWPSLHAAGEALLNFLQDKTKS
ncbi:MULTISPECIES: dCTP deaminase [unclassified Rhizobium]|uniref:dCTP deaminase n=1 Tax=unclassified Rhizobium TaxID=2613769 RepID=UPI00177F7162|nr:MULTISPECIES: deoxycytidine triphosphate deaminase [unclassified Rhizobium]MBD8689558.1 deoxycytidine triphosphate deaminase [Rhizobium sp. CFBP 13644]MBD8693920.1 deoxycytidine triphosphate deaminase [Rhizobium sp. CFBP 13717]